jgi:hypothetical protein
MQRREFLKYGAGVVGAIAVGGAGALFSRSARSAGVPTALSGSTTSSVVLAAFSYGGHDVQIVEEAGEVMMLLDGRMLPHYAFMRLRPDRWSSHLMPFKDESTPRALAEKLIDNSGRLFIL